MRRHFWHSSIVFFFILAAFIANISTVQADLIGDLKEKISNKGDEISQINEEIKKYEAEIGKTQGEAQTLSNAITILNTTRKKLSSEISAAEKKISALSYNIDRLNMEIKETETRIETSVSGIAESVRRMEEKGSLSLVEVMLSGQKISEVWENVNSIKTLQTSVSDNLNQLEANKATFLEQHKELSKTKKNVAVQKEELGDKKQLADANKKEKETLLNVTKSKEENYKKLLENKRLLKEQIERELHSYEAQLKIAIDPSKLPGEGKILSYPVDTIRITQYYGQTEFAKSGAYNGRGHTGMDFGVSLGSNVRSAADGVVFGTGNTDLGCPGGSHGKWVVVDHKNGLSTLYGHLSLIKVSTGQSVTRGQVIAYSGSTGYSTGPHLHFGVYATEGLRIGRLTRPNGTYSTCTEMPLSPLAGYLDPMKYL